MVNVMRRKDKRMTVDESINLLMNNETESLLTICETDILMLYPLTYVYFDK